MSSIKNCLFFSLLIFCASCGSEDSQSSSVSAADTPEMQTCRMAAQSMIDLAREAVNDPSSRPERRESRRVLLEDWVTRLAAGDNPCDVYADIGQASTTF